MCQAQKKSSIMDFNSFSEQFLTKVKNKENTNELRAKLYNVSVDDLEKGLKTDAQKIAFWVNIYNAYIQVILSENPDLYKDRGTFFKKEQIPLAGELISFEKIEHGIIRKSQWPLGLGKVRKLFPDSFERRLRVDVPDFHIHFALNCGAKDCPPVAVYTPKRLKEQFNKGTEKYLKRTSVYEASKETVAVTSLFSWFRGDFGGEDGVKTILKEYDIIPATNEINIKYKDYDWTLELNNFVEL